MPIDESTHNTILIVGAGPAGLAAAYELIQHDRQPVVLEKATLVGGIARTEQYKGYRFDIGGHRFYTQVAAIDQLWHDVLGEQFVSRPRLSRIYYNQRFFPYPLQLLPTLRHLGISESMRAVLSYLHAQIRPTKDEETFEDWVTNRFGRRLFNTFFKSYTEKVWGIPCSEIRAEWAAQRIKGLSLRSAVWNALTGSNRHTKTLINAFHYPVEGPGMMWEAFQSAIEAGGGQVHTDTKVTRLCVANGRVTDVVVRDETGETKRSVEQVVSSMPLDVLIRSLDPQPPAEVLAAAAGLNYRAFLIVGLIVNAASLFPDNWIYIHEPGVKVGRIQNFKNWSADMVPDSTRSSLGLEYFCNEGDDLWRMPDAELIALARREIGQLELADPALVEDGCVIRQPKAYPVYDSTYRQHLDIIQAYLATIENLQTIGRNGMHRYNNQDHSMLTGIFAARNLMGERHDLWQVNTERSYYEEWTVSKDNEPIDQPPTKSAFASNRK